MKNLICAIAIVLGSATLASADCCSGSCSTSPVRKAGSTVVSVAKRVLTAPFRIAKKARQSSQCGSGSCCN